MKSRKKVLTLLLLMTAGLGALSADEEPQTEEITEERSLTDDEITKISEAFGHLIGRSLDNPSLKFEMDAVIRGIQNAVAGKESPLSDEEYDEIIATVQEKAFSEMAESNLEDANQFVVENLKDPEVEEIEEGLVQVKVIQPGEGRVVREHACPIIHYTGSYLDGAVFGSSYDAGGPVTIPLDQTIPGFAKGLIGMREGERRRIFVHPDRGYGISGQLPPNSLLTFDVELIVADAYLMHTEDRVGYVCPGEVPMPPPDAGGAQPALAPKISEKGVADGPTTQPRNIQ